jgi:hypothetical protein
MGVARAPREFYPIEVLQHLDRQVAADARPVPESGGGDLIHVERDCLELAQRGRQEEAGLRHPHYLAMAREAREGGLQLFHFHRTMR